jgi:hypothetical protein
MQGRQSAANNNASVRPAPLLNYSNPDTGLDFDFSSALGGGPGQGDCSGAPGGPENEDDDANLELPEHPYLEQLKNQLAARGAKGIIGLQRAFRNMDDDGSNSLNFAEFKKAMRECKIVMTEAQCATLFQLFGKHPEHIDKHLFFRFFFLHFLFCLLIFR